MVICYSSNRKQIQWLNCFLSQTAPHYFPSSLFNHALRVYWVPKDMTIKIPDSWRVSVWANPPELQAFSFFRHLVQPGTLPSPKVLLYLPSRNRNDCGGCSRKPQRSPSANDCVCYSHRKGAFRAFFRCVQNQELFPVTMSWEDCVFFSHLHFEFNQNEFPPGS